MSEIISEHKYSFLNEDCTGMISAERTEFKDGKESIKINTSNVKTAEDISILKMILEQIGD